LNIYKIKGEKMKKEYDAFLKHIKESKENSVLFILQLLNEDKLLVKDIYFNFLIPAMKQIRHDQEDGRTLKWKAVLVENRLKTVIECTYPYIIKQKSKAIDKKALIVTIAGEQEQVGALIASNIFELAGFETKYIDSNIDKKEMLLAIQDVKPDYLTIGLKNFYNAFETQKLIDEILEKNSKLKIIVGGPVFKGQEVQLALKHNYFVKDYTEIFEIAKEALDETSTKNSN
jgi:MerR family transcriptional regulator, light-induced transcriptional regulator